MQKPDDAVPDAELMLQLQQQLAERKRLLDMQLQQVSRLKEEREGPFAAVPLSLVVTFPVSHALQSNSGSRIA